MTRRQIHVEILPPRFRRERVVLRARISGHPRGRKRNGLVFFEMPAEIHDWSVIQGKPDDLHDAFLRAVIFSGMEAPADITIHGSVSASLLENLETFQEIIHRWWPQEYQPVKIKADAEVGRLSSPISPQDREAVLAFSGGLDSAYSLYSHKTGTRGRNNREISSCLFVHGFDIPFRDRAFQAAFRRAERITQSLDVRLIPIRTNVRKKLPLWPQTHPAPAAAVLSLLGKRYSTGLLAASFAYDNPFAFRSNIGSTPLSDPFLSSDSFRIVHDGGHKTRVEKSEILRDWEVARKNLRVCWAGDDLSGNCGKCRKCVIQMLCMRAIGLEDLSAFKVGLTPESFMTLERGLPATIEEWQRCYSAAEKNGVASSEEFLAMKQVLQDWKQAPPATHATNGHRRQSTLGRVMSRILGKSWRRLDR